MSTPTEETSRQNEDTEKKEDIYEDWIPNATKMVEMIYNFCFQHYTSNPEEKISDIEHQIEKKQSESERSMFAYLKGRLYNAVPDVYKEEAEHYLVEATNLDPCLLDAWNCLGMCLAKKGDYRRAKNSFEFVLRMDQNSIILRQLAELELQFAPVAEDPVQQLGECIKYAQKTLALDDTDGRCYCKTANRI
ncbi:hypothetical protein K7X08_033832 [Anisodus acutangulus]|uniref:Tetratricopeptide repeat protein n=1 Tax=Anisodus acutangulus TaxID=402998 RepID=A0A9Q1RAH2_9SOLA|nr:hypothetical protein K7X08_033832 [Anisodus acutangulus]